MKWIVLVAVAALVTIWYAAYGRPWLKSKPWAAGFFAWVEPIELVLFKNSETILFARLKFVSGILLMLMTQLGTIDLTPIMPYIPEAYRGLVQFFLNLSPLALTMLGAIDERLRNGTTKPLELVAIPSTAVLPPKVEQAIAVAEQAKFEAVAEVKAAEKQAVL